MLNIDASLKQLDRVDPDRRSQALKKVIYNILSLNKKYTMLNSETVITMQTHSNGEIKSVFITLQLRQVVRLLIKCIPHI